MANVGGVGFDAGGLVVGSPMNPQIDSEMRPKVCDQAARRGETFCDHALPEGGRCGPFGLGSV